VEILNLGGAAEDNNPAPKSRKKLRVILGIGALAAVTGIGSTLAANISLNGGGNVEFGQGVATTAACDDSITLTPISEFSNTEEDPEFALTAVQVSGLDLTAEGWDVPNSAWATGYVPGHTDNGLWVDATWNDAIKEHTGQYISAYDGDPEISITDGNPIWTNTCANKSLMIHAYTDNVAYAYATDGNDIASPLMLSGINGHRPDNRLSEEFGDNRGQNIGIGFRVETNGDNLPGYWGILQADLLDNHADFSDGASWNPIDSNFSRPEPRMVMNNITYILYLNDDTVMDPPVSSKMVDKLTIESSATTPDGWWNSTL
jgi:hypothetical protein